MGPALTVAEIQKQVGQAFGFTVAQLVGRRGPPRLSQARQVAYYWARELTGYSYPRLGRCFGGRHHTTIIKGAARVRVYEQLRAALVPEGPE